jgi:hypothetical protein
MSTANFITNEELQDYDYKRVNDSIVPETNEKPAIIPLLWAKSFSLLIFLAAMAIITFSVDHSFNIDAVLFTR